MTEAARAGRKRWAALGFLALSVAAILVTTLRPAASNVESWSLCALCGNRDSADAILNVALFLPFGAAVAALVPSRRVALLLAATLSGVVEVAQILVPGREASVADVITNAVGGAGGAALLLSAAWWLRPDARRAKRFAAAASVATTLVLLATGLLLRPSYPMGSWYGQWTPDLGYLAVYRGHVLDAMLGSLELPSRRLDHPARSLATLLESDTLRVRFVAGPPVPRVASLFSIFDERRQGIFIVGPDRDDLVLLYRTRAAALAFDEPDLRLRGALRGVNPGDTLSLSIVRHERDHCVILNGRKECGLGYRIGQGWALLFYPGHSPPRLLVVLGALWLATLFAPVGYYGRARGGALWVLPPLMGLIAIPAILPLLSTTAADLASAGVGLLLGAILSHAVNPTAWPGPGR